MRTKALAVGVRLDSEWEGPWINLESGEWRVGPPTPHAWVEVAQGIFPLEEGLILRGPCRARLKIKSNGSREELHINAEQVK